MFWEEHPSSYRGIVGKKSQTNVEDQEHPLCFFPSPIIPISNLYPRKGSLKQAESRIRGNLFRN